VHRHNGYPKLVKVLREATKALEAVGCAQEPGTLKRALQNLGETLLENL
jgi:hypothetical protein